MTDLHDPSRRQVAASLVLGLLFPAGALAQAGSPAAPAPAAPVLAPIKRVEAGVLDIAYFEAGPTDGVAVMLMHGFPYDIHSYVEVAPMLAAQGYRVIVPYLRGHGPTRFLNAATPRSAQQAAIGADIIALMDALGIGKAVFAGYDWGGRGAVVAAALWPERCLGLVSVNSYLIQDIANAMKPAPRNRRCRCGTSTTSIASGAVLG